MSGCSSGIARVVRYTECNPTVLEYDLQLNIPYDLLVTSVGSSRSKFALSLLSQPVRKGPSLLV